MYTVKPEAYTAVCKSMLFTRVTISVTSQHERIDLSLKKQAFRSTKPNQYKSLWFDSQFSRLQQDVTVFLA